MRIEIALTGGETATVEAAEIVAVESVSGACAVHLRGGHSFNSSATHDDTVLAWEAALQTPTENPAMTPRAIFPVGAQQDGQTARGV